jgi:hypothetical protein
MNSIPTPRTDSAMYWNGDKWVVPVKLAQDLESELYNAKLLAEYNKDVDEVYWNFINESADAIERLGLSKVPKAGSLKSDEACSFAYIAEREIKNLRNQLAEAKLKLESVDKNPGMM